MKFFDIFFPGRAKKRTIANLEDLRVRVENYWTKGPAACILTHLADIRGLENWQYVHDDAPEVKALVAAFPYDVGDYHMKHPAACLWHFNDMQFNSGPILDLIDRAIARLEGRNV